MLIFMTLLLAHLIGDFMLQRSAIVDGKSAGQWTAWAEHAAVHGALLVAVWWLVQPASVSPALLSLGFGIIVLTHVLIDWVKSRFQGRKSLVAFLLDQAAHAIVLLLVTGLFLGGLRPLMVWMLSWHPLDPAWASIAVTYVFVVFACGWLNRLLLESLNPEASAEVGQVTGLADAGLRIGWLERFLMLSAFLVQAWAALGLVLAAKSVFRFEDLRKGRQHAEYFLIGTLISLSQVVLFGTVLKLILARLEFA